MTGYGHLTGPPPAEWHLPASSWTDWPEDVLVVIACSRSMTTRRAPAANLFTGSLFTLALRAARHVATGDSRIRILSARHGLVPLDRVLDPYDEHKSWNSLWPDELAEQAAEQKVLDAPVVLSLCPTDYWLSVGQVWRHAVDGFRGLSGITCQRQELARICAIPDDWLRIDQEEAAA